MLDNKHEILFFDSSSTEKEKESRPTRHCALSPLWVFTCDHEAAAVGQLVDGLSVVLQGLLQCLVLLYHYKCTLLILSSNREFFWLSNDFCRCQKASRNDKEVSHVYAGVL